MKNKNEKEVEYAPTRASQDVPKQTGDYVYFVSYYHSRGFGNAEVFLSDEIVSVNQIGELQKLIEQEYSLRDVTVVNLVPLRIDAQKNAMG